jgi:hypothetical protein
VTDALSHQAHSAAPASGSSIGSGPRSALTGGVRGPLRATERPSRWGRRRTSRIRRSARAWGLGGGSCRTGAEGAHRSSRRTRYAQAHHALCR